MTAIVIPKLENLYRIAVSMQNWSFIFGPKAPPTLSLFTKMVQQKKRLESVNERGLSRPCA